MVRIFHEENSRLDILKDKTIAVIGYGNQGRAFIGPYLRVGLGRVFGPEWENEEIEYEPAHNGVLVQHAWIGEEFAQIRARLRGTRCCGRTRRSGPPRWAH